MANDCSLTRLKVAIQNSDLPVFHPWKQLETSYAQGVTYTFDFQIENGKKYLFKLDDGCRVTSDVNFYAKTGEMSIETLWGKFSADILSFEYTASEASNGFRVRGYGTATDNTLKFWVTVLD